MITPAGACTPDWPPERFRSIIDNLREVVFQTDAEGRWTFLSRAWEEITGFSIEESLGALFPEFVHPDDREHNLEQFEPLIARQKDYCRHEVRFLTRDGGFRWIRVLAQLTLDGNGEVAGTSGTLADVTERVAAAEELRRSRQRLEFALAANPAVIFVARPGTGEAPWETTFISDNVRTVLGYEPDQFTSNGAFWLSTVHPDDLAPLRRSFAELAATGRATARMRRRRADGTWVWLRTDYQLAAGVPGQPNEIFGCLLDETHAREVEESLKAHAAVLEAVGFTAQRLLCGAWDEEIDGILERLGKAVHASRVYVFENHPGPGGELLASLRHEWVAEGIESQLGNPNLKGACYEKLGFARWMEVLGRGEPLHGNVADFPDSERPPLAAQQIQSVLATPIFTGRDWWGFIVVADCIKERVWRRSKIDALKAAAGILGAARKREETESDLLRSRSELEARVLDRTRELHALNERLRAEIAERKAAQQAVADREAHFRTLIENSSDVVFVLSAQGLVEYVSPAVTRVLGYEPGDLIGRSGFEFIDPKDAPLAQSRFRAGLIAAGTQPPVELQLRHRDGHYRIVEAIGSNQFANPVVQGGVITVRDITDRRRLEEQFRQAQKMEAVGRLAGGVAHDFNNLLTVICGYSELLTRTLPEGGAPRRNAAQIKRAGDRAAALVEQLLAFSRQQPVRPQVLDLNAAIGELRKMLQRLIGEDIDLSITSAPEPVYVNIDRTQLDQIILNLSVNARDAMPDGGVLSIAIRPEAMDDRVDCMACKAAIGEFAVMAVSDTGTGMTEETKGRIFEPFFTTKEVGKGTGLGLSMVYGAVRQAGGRICVETAPGKGSTFRVCLPMVRRPAIAQEAASMPGTRGGRERILIAEDEELVRTMISDTLRDAGYAVLEAQDGEEALEVLRGEASEIDLLLTDVVMPRMSGPVLAERLSALGSSAGVLYISGHPGRELAPGSMLLRKPFTADELLREVRSILDGQSEERLTRPMP